MSREIKFRAFNRQTKEMCWALLICFVNKYIDVLPERNMEGGSQESWRFEDIDLMQRTGLAFRGVDVYEGDVISLDGKHSYEVRFETGKFVLYHLSTHSAKGTKWGDLSRCFDHDFQEYSFFVAGNIYANPELL